MKVLGIIPARGGSKGVIRKNIRIVDGQPLIVYAIDCARESEKITEFIVNTDDEEIAQIAKQYGANVMMRPPELATDKTPMVDVVKYIIEYYKKNYNKEFDLIVVLQVTAPIRTGKDVDNVINIFEKDQAVDGVISVVAMQDMHPARMYNLDKDTWMQPFLGGDTETSNRQDLQPVYFRNGCIYAVKTEAFEREKKFMVKNKKAYIMPTEWLANIDDERDLIITEALLKHWKQTNGSINNRI